MSKTVIYESSRLQIECQLVTWESVNTIVFFIQIYEVYLKTLTHGVPCNFTRLKGTKSTSFGNVNTTYSWYLKIYSNLWHH